MANWQLLSTNFLKSHNAFALPSHFRISWTKILHSILGLTEDLQTRDEVKNGPFSPQAGFGLWLALYMQLDHGGTKV